MRDSRRLSLGDSFFFRLSSLQNLQDPQDPWGCGAVSWSIGSAPWTQKPKTGTGKQGRQAHLEKGNCNVELYSLRSWIKGTMTRLLQEKKTRVTRTPPKRKETEPNSKCILWSLADIADGVRCSVYFWNVRLAVSSVRIKLPWHRHWTCSYFSKILTEFSKTLMHASADPAGNTQGKASSACSLLHQTLCKHHQFQQREALLCWGTSSGLVRWWQAASYRAPYEPAQEESAQALESVRFFWIDTRTSIQELQCLAPTTRPGRSKLGSPVAHVAISTSQLVNFGGRRGILENSQRHCWLDAHATRPQSAQGLEKQIKEAFKRMFLILWGRLDSVSPRVR